MFYSIKEILKEALKTPNISSKLKIGNIKNIWENTVGETINKNTEIKYYKNKVLTIKAQSSVWRNELLFQKNDIIQKLNSKLEKNKIKDIRFL